MAKAVKKGSAKKSAKVSKLAKKSAASKKKGVTKTVKKAVKKVVKKGAKKAVKSKSKKVLVVPKGYHSITPYLIVGNAANAIEFYKKAFGAKEIMRIAKDNGKVKHAELQMGDSRIMLSDECHEMNTVSPQPCHRSPVGINLYIKDVDGVVERAVAAGAKLTRAVEDMFYGDRSGMIEDPFGHFWCVSTHIEDVTPAQMKKRMATMAAQSEMSKL